MDSQKNLLVITHRRSGTHLTIDAIRNNFAYWRKHHYVVLETLNSSHPKHIPLTEFEHKLKSGCRVVKLHYPERQMDEAVAGTELESILESSYRLYVVRNCFDVLASLYEFRKGHDHSVRKMSFGQFLREPTFDKNVGDMNKAEYWAYHVTSWLESGSRCDAVIRFEDWITEYKLTLKTIGQMLGRRPDWFGKDIRMNQRGKTNDSKILRTWVEPRKGKVNDFVNYFSAEDFDFVWERCGDCMKLVGYDHDSLRSMVQKPVLA
jgi:hypothetical protein